jgi:flagellar biosynthesis/type III secretory pathway M-ring protein FliF/YscJ
LNNLKLRAGQEVWTPLIGEPTAQQALQSAAAAAALHPPSAAHALNASRAEEQRAAAINEALPSYQNVATALPLPPEIERMQKSINRAVEQRPAIAAQVIRIWLEEDGQAK